MSGVIVVDEESNIIGIITLTDLFILMDRIAKGAYESSIGTSEKLVSLHDILEKGKDRSVSELMTKHVITISPETTLGEIIDMVVKWNIHTFPVVKDGDTVGVIDRHDILNAFFVYG